MKRIKFNKKDIPFIILNLVPVIGVWFFGWDPKGIFIVYALETVLVGLFTILRMTATGLYKKTDEWSNNGSSTQQHFIFFILFFIVHYGLFVAIQMGMFLSISTIDNSSEFGLFTFFKNFPNLMRGNVGWAMAAFFIIYLYQFITSFILNGTYKTASLGLLMFQPYIRIIIQQFTVILGSMILLFGAGKLFILVFAVIKIIIELGVDYTDMLNNAMKKQSGLSAKQ